MKKPKLFLPIIAFAVCLGFLFSGCRKSDRNNQKDYSTAIDNAEAQNVFDGIWKQLTQIVDTAGHLRTGCPTITSTSYTPGFSPKIVTIDFGTTNCTGTDQNNRRGQLIATFYGAFTDSLSKVYVSLNNFYHNEQLVEGTMIITNNGRNSSNHITYTSLINGVTITTATGKIIWNANQTREWISGDTTALNAADDIFLISGTSEGIGQSGNAFTTVIDEPLHIEVTCPWTGYGTMKVYPKNYPVIYMDYGNYTCDDVATVILNKKATEILLL